MKNFILLLLLALLAIPGQAKEKPFLDKYITILNKAYDDNLEIIRIDPKEIIDSLTLVSRTQTGEELAETKRSIDEMMNHKEIIVAGFQPNEDVVREYKTSTDKLLSPYEELIMVRKDQFAGKILGKLKKDKLTEVIIWLEADLTPPGLPSFFDFNWNMDFIINIPFIKPVLLEEWLQQANEEKAENPEIDDSFFDFIISVLGIDFGTESSFTMGEWLNEDAPAQNWKIMKPGSGDKYGLYDADGKTILEPEYDEIKNSSGFLRTESDVLKLYIHGFELTKDGKKGFANLNGEVIIPTEYDNLELFREGDSRYMRVIKNSKQGLADEITGELVIPVEYDNIRLYNGLYLVLEKDDASYKIDWDNETHKVIGSDIQLMDSNMIW